MITVERLQSLLEKFPRQTIGLVGDLFLDRYLDLESNVHELSIETGLEAYQITHVRNFPGALGTVMNNLAALGVGTLVPVTLIGDDGHGFDLRRALASMPVDPVHVISDESRLTPTYTKPLRRADDGSCTELNRLDVRTRAPMSDEATQRGCESVTAVWQRADGMIVLDQVNESNWGVINEAVREHLRKLCRQDPKKLMLIDSRAHLGKFCFGCLKGNRTEFSRALGMSSDQTWVARQAVELLANRNRVPAFCTEGEDGIAVARPAKSVESVPGVRVRGPVDIVGAGDSATSGIVASLIAGADPLEAACVGNLVASITVQQIGTTGTATPEQVLNRLRESASEE